MYKILGIALATLLLAGAAQAGYCCKKILYLEPYPDSVNWWIPSHVNPCGEFIPGHWSQYSIGYKVGPHTVYVVGHYNKTIGWVQPEYRRTGSRY